MMKPIWSCKKSKHVFSYGFFHFRLEWRQLRRAGVRQISKQMPCRAYFRSIFVDRKNTFSKCHLKIIFFQKNKKFLKVEENFYCKKSLQFSSLNPLKMLRNMQKMSFLERIIFFIKKLYKKRNRNFVEIYSIKILLLLIGFCA